MSQYIDKIFYINLDKRTDRREQIEAELAKMGLEGERFAAFYTPESGILGCGLSHLELLKLARKRGYHNVLILEDDFEFVVSKERMEELLEQVLDFNNGYHLEYDVLMVSYIIQKSEEVHGCPLIRKVIDGQTASGYIVHHKYYDTLIHLYEWSVPLLEKTNEHWNYGNDSVWKRLQPNDNWYYLVNRLGKQRASFSDNKMCVVENNDGYVE
jgi:glycosyl transferase family 25